MNVTGENEESFKDTRLKNSIDLELLDRDVRIRTQHFAVLVRWIVSFGNSSILERLLLVFVAGMINLSTKWDKETTTMNDSKDRIGADFQKEIIMQQIESLVILARQRGLPVNGFPRSELELISVVDLQVVHDGLHELVYAPPVRR